MSNFGGFGQLQLLYFISLSLIRAFPGCCRRYAVCMNCNSVPDSAHCSQCRKIRRISHLRRSFSPEVRTKLGYSDEHFRYNGNVSRSISTKKPTTTRWRTGATVVTTPSTCSAMWFEKRPGLVLPPSFTPPTVMPSCGSPTRY